MARTASRKIGYWVEYLSAIGIWIPVSQNLPTVEEARASFSRVAGRKYRIIEVRRTTRARNEQKVVEIIQA